MRPVDFYALPNRSAEAWYDSYRLNESLFDDDALERVLDEDRGKAEGADALAYQSKLYAFVDEDAAVEYLAAAFDGKPFAILVRTGQACERLVTDAVTYMAARDYLDGFRKRDLYLGRDCVGLEDEPDILRGGHGHWIGEVAGETRLVDVGHVALNGQVIHDQKAFEAALGRLTASEPRCRYDAFTGEEGERQAAVVAQAVLESLPEGVRGTVDFEPPPATGAGRREHAWKGVLVQAGHGTYTVGVTAADAGGYRFCWRDALSVECIGPTELYDELARDPSPRP